MPRCVFKPNPDKDEYVVWSTSGETYVSPPLKRAEMINYHALVNTRASVCEEALGRADLSGASWEDDRSIFWGTQLFLRNVGAGDQTYTGYCRFEDLGEVVRAVESLDHDLLESLIQEVRH
ncbi:hypothetical protein CPHO_05990 [Corynebacterium phocae]|uniref:Uncharacterized protein n=1 Tax=Corynebacterium phocae TaxID=161895 RepID=A0A1L7D338_9CORY|nr:hypothetical protein [Corynebacterium phocae]APT92515.1 hypothetical protein CPHO_05990 [Corynebacterium phocae]KAA8725119.1 hypothetical protein F4V58_05530 [Corynebacterium phocae]